MALLSLHYFSAGPRGGELPPPVAEPRWSGGVHLEALANLAHELRTPIQVLLGSMDILREETAAPAPRSFERVGAIVETMNSNLYELARTVENVMEFAFAEAEAEAATEEDIEVAELMAEVEPVLEAANREKRLALRVDLERAPGCIGSQRRRLRAILENLALNAIKFTARGYVAITVREGQANPREAIELEVRDTGPGIDPAFVELAMQRLVQLSHGSVRRYRGLGLGLAVVQRNVKMLGGKMQVETEPGAGSSFKVTIPCRVRRECNAALARA